MNRQSGLPSKGKWQHGSVRKAAWVRSKRGAQQARGGMREMAKSTEGGTHAYVAWRTSEK